MPRGTKRTLADLMALKEVTTSGCWEWTGFRDGDGYGRTSFESKSTGIHRISYEQNVGPIPTGQFVCHRCDNPPCFNPDHLFLGDALVNNRDKEAKLRANRYQKSVTQAEKYHLTPADVKTIYESHDTNKDLADRYSVATRLIRRIRSGVAFRLLT